MSIQQLTMENLIPIFQSLIPLKDCIDYFRALSNPTERLKKNNL